MLGPCGRRSRRRTRLREWIGRRRGRLCGRGGRCRSRRRRRLGRRCRRRRGRGRSRSRRGRSRRRRSGVGVGVGAVGVGVGVAAGGAVGVGVGVAVGLPSALVYESRGRGSGRRGRSRRGRWCGRWRRSCRSRPRPCDGGSVWARCAKLEHDGRRYQEIRQAGGYRVRACPEVTCVRECAAWPLGIGRDRMPFGPCSARCPPGISSLQRVRGHHYP